MDQEAREALKERRVINGAAVSKEGPESLLLSADERVSITLDGEDHIRLQCICGWGRPKRALERGRPAGRLYQRAV